MFFSLRTEVLGEEEHPGYWNSDERAGEALNKPVRVETGAVKGKV